eukprot:CAMPEP_0174249690 /NCGR_PEP_ID=MMETSP0417-20130205/43486_1 /TAXON_ID=242541 /ORGANISM="Mayorella sp, Strain BSH-02190019" /LENGTH=524 /DNA_ID=CAMNT_0015329559 /DNA_START=207 /DNA_END=1781 /DNA_ORIENTATION=-
MSSLRTFSYSVCVFIYECSTTSLEALTLHVELLDHDRLSSDDPIGEAQLVLDMFSASSPLPFDTWLPVMYKGKQHGKVHLLLQPVSKNTATESFTLCPTVKQGFLENLGGTHAGELGDKKRVWVVLRLQHMLVFSSPELKKQLAAVSLAAVSLNFDLAERSISLCVAHSTFRFRCSEDQAQFNAWRSAFQEIVCGGSARFDPPLSGSLHVELLRGRDLPAMDLGGTSDPFCLLTLAHQQERTQVIDSSLNPVWSRSFHFSTTSHRRELHIIVYDHDFGRSNDFMGQVSIPLSELTSSRGKPLKKWWPVYTKSGKPTKGELELELTYDWELPCSAETRVFGTPLATLLAREQRQIPQVVEQCATRLREVALELQGLFRVPGSNAEIRQLRQRIDAGEEFDASTVDHLHTLGSLFKLYFRELPEPLVPHELYQTFVDAHDKSTETLAELIAALPAENRALLAYLMSFLDEVQASEGNLMNVQNLAIVFGPTILQPEMPTQATILQDMMKVNAVTALLIMKHAELFS